MPIYEFKCKECEKTEEFLLKFSDPKPTTCSSCGGEVAQLISQTSFALKGSGWYVTDYKPQPKGEGSTTNTIESEKKTETVPAAATTSAPAQSTSAAPAATPAS